MLTQTSPEPNTHGHDAIAIPFAIAEDAHRVSAFMVFDDALPRHVAQAFEGEQGWRDHPLGYRTLSTKVSVEGENLHLTLGGLPCVFEQTQLAGDGHKGTQQRVIQIAYIPSMKEPGSHPDLRAALNRLFERIPAPAL